MKYHLFAGEVYYARGGTLDYQKSSDTIEDLVKYFEENENTQYWEWYHITDSNLQIVKEKGRAHSYA